VGLPLDARDIVRSYRSASGLASRVLDLRWLRVAAGESVGVTGPSGSGKTSLLNVLTGLDRPERGEIRWGEQEIWRLPEGQRDRWRCRTVGFIFQEFNLFLTLSPLDNVLLPASFRHLTPSRALRGRAQELLEQVGLGGRREPVALLSRGETQRVAVARALLFAPPVVVADEPTASLDVEAAGAVVDLLLSIRQRTNSTLVVVSHDRNLLDRLDRVEMLVNGQIVEPALATAW